MKGEVYELFLLCSKLGERQVNNVNYRVNINITS